MNIRKQTRNMRRFFYLMSLCCLLNSCVSRYISSEIQCVYNYEKVFIDTIIKSHYVPFANYDSVANNITFDTCRWSDTTIRRTWVGNIYLDWIENALSKDSIPDFFYDPCLDYTFLVPEDFEHNCRINSFRSFAMHNLSDANLQKILSLGNVKKLKKRCKKKEDN